MNHEYFVGFKDVYPWVWSVMLGVSLTLADKRRAFAPFRDASFARYWLRLALAILCNLAIPATLFGFTLVKLGPMFDANMGVEQTLDALYLALTPLGGHHLWILLTPRSRIALASGDAALEREWARSKLAHLAWVFFALLIPMIAVMRGVPSLFR